MRCHVSRRYEILTWAETEEWYEPGSGKPYLTTVYYASVFDGKTGEDVSTRSGTDRQEVFGYAVKKRYELELVANGGSK